MVKSPEAFRTIREVAEWLDTPAHVLRFWESRFAQVKPVKRAGGRRYYRPADMELLGGIKQLLHEDGLTIRGVQKLLREQGVGYVAAKSPTLGLAAEPAADADGRIPERAPEAARTDGHGEAPSRSSCAPAGTLRPGEGAGPGVRSGQTSGGEVDPRSMTAGIAHPPIGPGPARAAEAGAKGSEAPHGAGVDRPPRGNERLDLERPVPLPEGRAPLLPLLWERRRSGALGETGPALARARALLQAMDARD